MKEIMLLLFYGTLLTLFVQKCSFFSLEKISKRSLLFFFYAKSIAALVYVYISKSFIKAGDIFQYYKDSLIIFEQLKEGAILNYLQLCFGFNNVDISDNIAVPIQEMGFWFDTSAYMIVRINAFFNLLTFGKSIYINAIFFAFFSFLGSILLIKLFQKYFNHKKTSFSYIVFLTPTLLYWTSGMHKESVCVFLIALFLFSFFQILHSRNYKYLFFFLVSFLLLGLVRYFIVLLLLPSLVAYTIWYFKKNNRPIIVFSLVYLVLILSLTTLPIVFNQPNIVDEIIAKRDLYEALDKGTTAINLGKYDKSYCGILKKTPQALFNTLIRPHFLDIKSPFLAIASLESLLISILLFSSLFYIKFLSKDKRALILLFLSFCICYLILNGLIVPNIGAILRYRSISLFLLVPIIAFLMSKKDQLL